MIYFYYFALQDYLAFTLWGETTLFLASQHMESYISKLENAVGSQDASGSPANSVKCKLERQISL
jgi:hypothetical protein